MDQNMLEEETITEANSTVDFKRLLELTKYGETGSVQLASLVKNWESKMTNGVRLVREDLDVLSRKRQEVELKRLEILEEQCVATDVEHDTIPYWKGRAMHVEKLLECSVKREQLLVEKMQENIEPLETQSSLVEDRLKRANHFLHFILQNAPSVLGHQDKELRYRYICNHFPGLQEEDIIGKTDVEIFSGAGVKECQDFKKEVLERGLPAKREITYDTGLFGTKTFLVYAEPVFSKAGDTIGVNYVSMDVTDQVIKRGKMAKLREKIAAQKAQETEPTKTILIAEETMRAKHMLVTLSDELRSPLTGVVSMAKNWEKSELDSEQRQLLDDMISSGNLVLQLISDLPKAESGSCHSGG